MVRFVHHLSKLRKDFVFLHFGDGPLRGEVESLIRELNIGSFYRLLGFVEEVEDFFSIFDVYVMSSSQEGLGSSVLDAFIYKVPVVSTDAGGLRETVGEWGFLCPVGDYRCLAEKANRVLSEEKTRREIVEHAYERAVTFHSLESVTERYIELFKTMLNTDL
jgi:glycosyltransferase involved in cell wall biosynthesis